MGNYKGNVSRRGVSNNVVKFELKKFGIWAFNSKFYQMENSGFFRTAIGHKGSKFHKHIDWFKKFIFLPLFPFMAFRRSKIRIRRILRLIRKKDPDLVDDIYFKKLLSLFNKISYDKLEKKVVFL